MSVPIEPPTLLVVETQMTGHRPSYLRRILTITQAMGHHVVLGMPASCFEHPAASSLVEKLAPSGSLTIVKCNEVDRESAGSNPLKMLNTERKCRRFYSEALSRALSIHPIDLIVINMLDDAALVSGMIGLHLNGIPWLGIVMRQNFHFTDMGVVGPPRTMMGKIKRKLFLRLLNLVRGKARVMTIDPTLRDYIWKNHPESREAIAHIPDPVDDKGIVTHPNMRHDMGIPDNAVVVMAYGTLRANKGVSLLLKAASRLPENVHVMLVGTQHHTISTCVNEFINDNVIDRHRVHQVNRYIDVSEDPDFFNAADVIWIGYTNYFSMSAVLVQAAQYRKPVLAARTGLIGWLTKKYNTGVVVDTENLDDVIKGLEQLIGDTPLPEERNYAGLVSTNDLATFEKSLLDNIAYLNQL